MNIVIVGAAGNVGSRTMKYALEPVIRSSPMLVDPNP